MSRKNKKIILQFKSRREDDVMATEKTCNQCGAIKPLEQFHIKKNAKDGHRKSCATCANIQLQQARELKQKKIDAFDNEQCLLFLRKPYSVAIYARCD